MSRKTFLIILLGLLVFVPNLVLADTISLDLASGSYKVGKSTPGKASFDMEGFNTRGDPGNPLLPEKSYAVLLPPDVVPGSIKLTVAKAESEALAGAYDIQPAAPAMTWDGDKLIEDWGQAKNVSNGKNLDVYGKDALWPPEPAALGNFSQIRKWKFVWVQFNPVQYNPVKQKATCVKSAKINISFARSKSQVDQALLRPDSSDDVARELFINYDEAKTWYVTGIKKSFWGPKIGYAIITTNAIVNNSAKLASFVAHKQRLGYSVYVVTENDYGALAGQAPNHRAEKIRKWLIDNYKTKNIEYVLLIGNPTPFYRAGVEGDIPMKMCWPRRGAGSYQEAPTDYFFADLTGNWDLDGDGYYGEWSDYTGVGGVDLAAEVWVARIPVYNGAYGTLDNILQKTINYENAVWTSWRKSILLPMGFQHPGYDGAPLGEQARNDYLRWRGYQCWRQYQQGNGECGLNSIYWSEQELRGGTVVRNRWAWWRYGIVMWWGHGDKTSAYVGYAGCWDGNLFSVADTNWLNDKYPSFTYQCSCLNGYPEASNNLQYSILKKGGIGTVSATRVSWFNTGVGYGQFDGSATNSGIGYEYVSRLTQKIRAAKALYTAKLAVATNIGGQSAYLMNEYDFNLYGDPAVPITRSLWWWMFQQNPWHTGQTSFSGWDRAPQMWWSYIVCSRVPIDPAVSVDGTLYFGASDNRVYALDSVSLLKWSYATAGDIGACPAIDASESVHVGSEDNVFYAFSSNGSLNWTYITGDKIQSPPVLDDSGRLYFGSNDNNVYTLDSNGSFIWSYLTDGDEPSSPAIGASEEVYIGGCDYRIHAYTSEGAFYWSYLTGGEVQSSPSIGASYEIYIGSDDNRVYSFDSVGAFTWSYLTNDDVRSTASIAENGMVYIGSRDNVLYALNSAGALAWSYTADADVDGAPMIDNDGVIYFGFVDNVLWTVNSDFSIRWSYQDGDRIKGVMPSADGILILKHGAVCDRFEFLAPPTDTPTSTPPITTTPTLTPTQTPTITPTITPTPTLTPTWNPSVATYTPTQTPTLTPTITIIWTPLPYGPWPMFRRYSDHRAMSGTYAVECVGALAWVYETGGEVISSPIQSSDGNVYVGSLDNVFYAFSPTGDFEWSYVTADPIAASPAINGVGNVYVGSEDNNLYAFNSVGGLRWSYRHPGDEMVDQWESSPTIDTASAIYMQARSSLCVFTSIGSLSWSFNTTVANLMHASSPALGPNGQIYLGTGDEYTLYAVSSNCTLDWSYILDYNVESSPAVGSAGNVYVGCYDNNLYAFTSAGTLAWTYATDGSVFSSPAVDTSGGIYIGAWDNNLYAFASVGALTWSYNAGDDVNSSPAIDARGWVYVGAQDNRVYAFTANGTLVWSFGTGGAVDSSPAIGSGGRLFVGSTDNNVYALGTASKTYTLRGSTAGKTNWVAIPFCDTGIDTTRDLGDSIGAAYNFTADDVVAVSYWDGTSTSTLTGTSLGDYEWDWSGVSVDIPVGAMCKVVITVHVGGSDIEFDWTVTGCACPVQFALYDADTGVENWISLPWYKWYLTTTQEVGESIAAVYEPAENDTLQIAVWNGVSEDQIIGTYLGEGEWDWSGVAQEVWHGRPFIVRLDYTGSPTIYWP